MKINNTAVIIITAATMLISCKWLNCSGKEDTSKSLIGKWGFVTVNEKFVTVNQKKDSTRKDSASLAIDQFIASLHAMDTTNSSIEFRTDSSYHIYNGDSTKDSGKYYVDTAHLTLYIKDSAAYVPLKINRLTDTTIEFFLLNDSTPVQLHKKQ